MKKITLIHTLKSVYNSFEGQLKAALKEEIKVSNIMDDFLANDSAERGEFTPVNFSRFLSVMNLAVLTEPDMIIVTCSSLSGFVGQYRHLFKVRVVAIDDEMAELATRRDGRILVMATAPTAVAPTVEKLTATAQKAGTHVIIDHVLDYSAIVDLKAGNKESHDRQLLARAATISGYDSIVLAQGSMGHLQKQIQDICKVEVFAPVELCIQRVKRMLEGV